MKTSISVPDKLWNTALTASASTSPSGVVQEALEQLVESKRTNGSPDLPADLTEQLNAARNRHLAEVREEFAIGYRDGVELISQLTWRQVAYLAEPQMGMMAAGRALTRMLVDQDQKQAPPEWKPIVSEDLLVKYLGSHAEWRGIVDWHPSPERVEGMDAALRDHYTAVKAGR